MDQETREKGKLLLVVAFAAVLLLVLFWFLNLLSRQMPKPIAPVQEPQDEERIFSPDQAYGLTGTIREVNKEESILLIETVALPYAQFKPESGQMWTWKVVVSEDTELVTFILDEPEELEEDRHENPTESIAFEEIAVGDHVTFTAKEDIVSQFPLAEKRVEAVKIQITKSSLDSE